MLGGITGFGGRTFVRRALQKLEDNIERNDTTIDVVGFSRGAALALDFVNEIAKGKVKLANGSIPTVRFLGLFDCVPSFGIPISPLNIGWDLDLPANVTRCFHALSLDERRGNFHLHRPKVLGQPQAGRLTEVWFRGVHSDVGGNGDKEMPPRGLASIPLNWMFVNAQAAGLQFDPAQVAANKASGEGRRPRCSTTSTLSRRTSASFGTVTWFTSRSARGKSATTRRRRVCSCRIPASRAERSAYPCSRSSLKVVGCWRS